MLPEAVEAVPAALRLAAGNASSLHATGRPARRRRSRSRASSSPRRSAPGRPRWSSPAAAPRATTWRSRALFWARRAADPRRRRIAGQRRRAPRRARRGASGSSTTRAPTVTWLPVDEHGRVHPDVLAAALGATRDVALVSVMWANNEVGTVQPVAELAEVAHAAGVPLHTDAVQAVGQLPVDFAASGVDALTLTGHKFGGPLGVGALLLGRDVDCTPLLHGGGQERDVRSGHARHPGARRARRRHRGRRRAGPTARTPGWPAARRPGAPGPRGGARRGRSTASPDAAGCRATRTSPSPAARATRCCCCSTPAASRCSTGSACSAGVARPSTCCSRMGADEDRARGSLRFSLGHTSTAADVDALVDALPAVVERARRRAGPAVRLLAAMSGGVDSAVAAALAVEAGHDVTGVHLALSAAPADPAHRLARLLLPRGRPRRPPGRRRARHPVLRLGPRRAVPGRRRRRLRRRVRRRPHAEPVPALQREDQVHGRAGPGAGARLRRRRHRPPRAARRRGAAPLGRRSPRTSPTCSRC